MKDKGISQSKIIEGYEDKQIRCLNCNKRLFDGWPGFDIITGDPRILRKICPKCGEINLIHSEIYERIIIEIE
ncbi:hypothetical protein ES708_14490 [subsurface metagenome]